jgi:DNA-binding response OmpR family regulator
MAKILIVEDDIAVSEAIKNWLEKEHFIVETIVDGKEAFERLRLYHYDLAVIDWQVPSMDGAHICLELRKGGSVMPILMLTSRASLDDRVEGLDAGAYDYLVKPASMKELTARIRALLRRRTPDSAKTLIVGDLEIRHDTHEVSRAGALLPLLPMEYEILKFLCSHQDISVSDDALLSRLWTDKSQVSSQLVKAHVKNLRKKLEEARSIVSIATSKNEGYVVVVHDNV